MRFNDLIDNLMEATMSATTTPRYDFAPTAAFATTRAGAKRRAREAATAATTDNGQLPTPNVLRRFFAFLTGSAS
jgi:hypothetical protein